LFYYDKNNVGIIIHVSGGGGDPAKPLPEDVYYKAIVNSVGGGSGR